MQRVLCKYFFAMYLFANRSRHADARATRLDAMPNENPLLSPSAFPYGLPDYAAIRPEHYLPAFEHAFAAHTAEVVGDHARALDADVREHPRPARREREASRRCRAHVLHRVVGGCDARDPGDRRDSSRRSCRRTRTRSSSTPRSTGASRRSTTSSIELDLDAGAALPRRASLPRDVARRRRPRRRREGAPHRAQPAPVDAHHARSRRTCSNDTNDLAVVFDDVAELDGLTEGELSAAAQAAADRGLDGKWVVTLTLFTGHPYLVVA